MRIIAGELKSRQFKSPHTHQTHPMGDKVRTALFNILGDISGLEVLDAYAGSGALSFEAVSRGARNAYAIDRDKHAYSCILENITSLGLGDRVRVTKAHISSWSDNNTDRLFDIILCDPPYDTCSEPHVRLLCRHLRKNATLALSWPSSKPPPNLPSVKNVGAYTYSDAQLLFYKPL